jgi:phospholipase C
MPPAPAQSSPIAHVVVLFQENRSFDNLFAGFPGADTATAGPCVPNATRAPDCRPGKLVPLHAITLQTTGIGGGGRDIQHDHPGFETEFNGGKMNGFDLIASGTVGNEGWAGLYPYAYVERSEVAPYWTLAKTYTLADHMFSTATTDSFVAHQEIIAGTTRLNDRESLTDTPTHMPWGCDAPLGTATAVLTVAGNVLLAGGPFPCFTRYKTMADVLDAADVSWKYYVMSDGSNGNYPEWSGIVWDGFDAIEKIRCASFEAAAQNCIGFGADWKTHISQPNTSVFSDIKKGTLPAVSWVIPTLPDSDHPQSGADSGPSWVASVVNAVGKSAYWKNTVIVLLWDDWGGFYDNVPPPQLDYTSLGMRVPLIVISPYAKRGYVSHTQYEIGSILKYIEQNFHTASLGSTDVRANSLIDSLDYTQIPAPFASVAAKYPASFFLSHRTFPKPSFVLEHDGGIIPE